MKHAFDLCCGEELQPEVLEIRGQQVRKETLRYFTIIPQESQEEIISLRTEVGRRMTEKTLRVCQELGASTIRELTCRNTSSDQCRYWVCAQPGIASRDWTFCNEE